MAIGLTLPGVAGNPPRAQPGLVPYYTMRPPLQYDGTAARFPHPLERADECGRLLEAEGDPGVDDTWLCDPDEAIMRALRQDQLRFAIAAIRAWERDFSPGLFGGFGARVGLALVPWTIEPLPHFATKLAAAWGLDNATGVLIALRHGDVPAVALAGGLLSAEGAIEAAPEHWEEDLRRQTVAFLRGGLPGKAVEAALSGLADAIGGGLGRGMSTLGGTNSGVKQEMVKQWKTQYQVGELWRTQCAEERCYELFLDDVRQFSDRFERYYHEVMSYPALNIIAASGSPPKRALMLGGGDGGIATRILAVGSVDHMTVLDIDAEVTRVAKKWFPQVSASTSDPRLELLHTNAIEWVNERAAEGGHRFDLIVIDFTDVPLGGGWSGDFFANLRSLLTPSGVLVQNVGSMLYPDGLKDLLQHHAKAFKSTFALTTFIPDYAVDYVLALSSPSEIDPWQANWSFWERQHIETQYYTPELHFAILAMPRSMKRWLGVPVESSPGPPLPLQKTELQAAPPDKAAQEGTNDEVLDHTGNKKASAIAVLRQRDGYCPLGGGECRELRASNRPILNMHTQHQDEAMTLPAMNILGSRAKRVLILGGATGYMASMVLQYDHVERVVVADSAQITFQYLSKWFPSLAASFEDKRVTLEVEDAYDWLLRQKEDPFDLVVVAMKHSPWWKSNRMTRVPGTSRFLAHLRSMLAPHGLLVQEAGSVQTPRHARRMVSLHRGAFPGGSVWPIAHGLSIEMFDGSPLDGKYMKPPAFSVISSPTQFDPLGVDWDLWAKANVSAFHYTPDVHQALFVLPMEAQRLLGAPPPLGLVGVPRTWGLPEGLVPPEESAAAVISVSVDARGCSTERLASADISVALLRELAIVAGLAASENASREFSSEGVAAALLVSGSHLAIRTWSATGYAAVDLVSCEAIDAGAVERLRAAIRDGLGCQDGVSARRSFRGAGLGNAALPPPLAQSATGTAAA